MYLPSAVTKQSEIQAAITAVERSLAPDVVCAALVEPVCCLSVCAKRREEVIPCKIFTPNSAPLNESIFSEGNSVVYVGRNDIPLGGTLM